MSLLEIGCRTAKAEQSSGFKPISLAVLHSVVLSRLVAVDDTGTQKLFGTVGAVVLGHRGVAQLRHLLVYDKKKAPIVKLPIVPDMVCTLEAEGGVRIYDDMQQSWIAHFRSSEDWEGLARALALARSVAARAMEGSSRCVMVQDVALGEVESSAHLQDGDLVVLAYTLWAEVPGMPGQLGPAVHATEGLEQGVLGMSKGGCRFLVVPAHLGYGFQPSRPSQVPAGAALFYDVTVLKIKKQPPMQALLQQRSQSSSSLVSLAAATSPLLHLDAAETKESLFGSGAYTTAMGESKGRKSSMPSDEPELEDVGEQGDDKDLLMAPRALLSRIGGMVGSAPKLRLDMRRSLDSPLASPHKEGEAQRRLAALLIDMQAERQGDAGSDGNTEPPEAAPPELLDAPHLGGAEAGHAMNGETASQAAASSEVVQQAGGAEQGTVDELEDKAVSNHATGRPGMADEADGQARPDVAVSSNGEQQSRQESSGIGDVWLEALSQPALSSSDGRHGSLYENQEMPVDSGILLLPDPANPLGASSAASGAATRPAPTTSRDAPPLGPAPADSVAADRGQWEDPSGQGAPIVHRSPLPARSQQALLEAIQGAQLPLPQSNSSSHIPTFESYEVSNEVLRVTDVMQQKVMAASLEDLTRMMRQHTGVLNDHRGLDKPSPRALAALERAEAAVDVEDDEGCDGLVDMVALMLAENRELKRRLSSSREVTSSLKSISVPGAAALRPPEVTQQELVDASAARLAEAIELGEERQRAALAASQALEVGLRQELSEARAEVQHARAALMQRQASETIQRLHHEASLEKQQDAATASGAMDSRQGADDVDHSRSSLEKPKSAVGGQWMGTQNRSSYFEMRKEEADQEAAQAGEDEQYKQDSVAQWLTAGGGGSEGGAETPIAAEGAADASERLRRSETDAAVAAEVRAREDMLRLLKHVLGKLYIELKDDLETYSSLSKAQVVGLVKCKLRAATKDVQAAVDGRLEELSSMETGSPRSGLHGDSGT
eukprot:SM000002S05517  [mRNA]  locus=s2:295839:302164:- [translate_table: standard]